MADNIFTDEQLYLMRNLIADICYRHIEKEELYDRPYEKH